MKVRLVLPPCDDLQSSLINCRTRFHAGLWGRRCGKSAAVLFRCIKVAARGGTCWWVWPSVKSSRPGWRLMLSIGTDLERKIPGVKLNRSERLLTFPGGGEIQIKSAERTVRNVGDAVDLAVVDESALVRETAIEEEIMPALADREGSLVLVGAPLGNRGYFWDRCEHARRGEDPDWSFSHRTTFDSPYVPDAEKARIQRAYRAGQIAERYFLQQYMAQFVSDAGAVFQNVLECVGPPELDEPSQDMDREHRSYYIGVDWGKYHDSTWFVVINDQMRVVHAEPMEKIDYELQAQRLRSLCGVWKPVSILAEQNAMGDPVIERLERLGLPVEAFSTDGSSKKPLIEELAIAIRTRSIVLPPNRTMIEQLQAYEMSRKETASGPGVLKYGAPWGKHDDAVIALALAFRCVQQGSGVGSALV